MSLDAYWAMYDATLARIRNEKPDTFTALKAILDAFEPPSSGDAFFPGGADDTLGDAMHDAGWFVTWEDGDYLWNARHPRTGSMLRHVEGDIYEAGAGWGVQPMVQTFPTTDAAPETEENPR